MTNLKLMQLNTENLAIHLEFGVPKDLNNINESDWQKLTYAQTPNKPLIKTQALAEAILDENPDILILSEIMGNDSATNFNDLFLNQKYEIIYNETNSKRGIDLAYFVKKDLGLSYKIITHKKRKIFLPDGSIGNFCRDIAELQVFKPNNSLPILVILSVHLKSQISTENDAWGINVRRAEVESLVRYYNKIQKLYPYSSIVITGDFNGHAGIEKTSFEFSPIYEKTKLLDFHDLKKSSSENRASYVYFNHQMEPINQQLDYFFLNEKAQKEINLEASYAYRYKYFGYPWPLITNFKDKKSLPSDHYPQVITLNIKD